MQQLLENPTAGTEVQIQEGFHKLIDFAKQWKLEEMIAELYEVRGRFYYNTYQYNEALKDFFNTIEYHLKRENYHKIASIYNLIGVCHYHLLLYDQAIMFYNRVEEIIDTHDPSNSREMSGFSLRNKILCYRRIKKFDIVFKLISTYKEMSNEENEYYYQVLMMEGNSYRDIGNYEKARKVYNKLLKRASHLPDSMLFLIYENYADLYQLEGNYKKSLSCTNEAYQYITEEKPNYMTYLFLIEAKVYWKLGDIQKAYSIIEKGLILSMKVVKPDMTFLGLVKNFV